LFLLSVFSVSTFAFRLWTVDRGLWIAESPFCFQLSGFQLFSVCQLASPFSFSAFQPFSVCLLISAFCFLLSAFLRAFCFPNFSFARGLAPFQHFSVSGFQLYRGPPSTLNFSAESASAVPDMAIAYCRKEPPPPPFEIGTPRQSDRLPQQGIKSGLAEALVRGEGASTFRVPSRH